MHDLTVLIKPASSLCNLRCRYCFYHSIADLREQASYGIMTREVAISLIKKALDSANYITFAFQGGEPTLAGLNFFENFVSDVQLLNQKKATINYALQTNGVGLTEAFAKFLQKHDFLVGLSLDGPKNINDWMRVDASDKSVFQRVINTTLLFNKYEVKYNILCVVNSAVAKHIEQVYQFYKKQGFEYLQFIPCLEPLDAPAFSEEYSLTSELYASFLIRLFHLWANDFLNGHYISIRFFDNLVRVYTGQPSGQCGMQGICPGQYVVESDGSVFPCDFYCVDNWRIGNIVDMSFDEILNSPMMQKFIATSRYDDKKCNACEYYKLCKGGCRRDRDASTNGVAGDNRYCDALKQFYAEAAPRLSEIVRKIRR